MSVSCQDSEHFSIVIKKGNTCTDVLVSFKNKYNALIAYSPTLSAYHATADRILTASSIEHLFGKICSVYQLEFASSGQNSFLVRSEAKDIEQAEDVILHIRLEDSQDKTPVTYAAIYDDSRHYYGFTDEDGDCFIKIPKNKRVEKLNIHSLAHQDKTININTENLFFEVKLYPDPVKVVPVTINTLKKKLSFTKGQAVSSDQKILEQVLQSSVFQKDVMRALQILPGVSAINDSKAGIRIRGANEEATLLILDEMPVYKADHFFGIFGAFNSWYVKDISLFKNNIPVDFGGRTSGLVKMESEKAIKPFQLNLDLNLLNSGAFLNIPVGNHLAFSFSGRTTYTELTKSGFYDLSQRQNIENPNASKSGTSQITSNPSFDFYDINGKVLFSKGNHRVEANIFNSKDRFNDKYDITFKVRNTEVNDELFNQVSQWQNLTTGLNYSYKGKDSELKFSGYFTSHFNNYDITSNIVRRDKNRIIRDTVKILNRNDIKDTGLKLSYKMNQMKGLLFGLEHIIHDNELYIENDKNPVFEINRRASESSIFTQISFGDKSDLYIEPGIRTSVFHSLKTFYLLPQIYISKSLQKDMLIKASAGRQAQLVRLFEHENALGQKQQFFALSNNSSVPVGISNNIMLGIWKSFGRLNLDIEAYYRTLDGAVIHATQMPGLRPPDPGVISNGFLLFKGESQTKGIDISFSYEHDKYFSMLTYTLSKSDNRFAQLFKNQLFPSSEDSRHQLKWVNTISIGKFDFSGTYIGATGRPYLDLSSIRTPIERANLVVENYIQKLPAYHRFDVGAYFKFKLAGYDSRIGFSVFNLMNRVNVKYRQFVYQLPPLQGQQNLVNTILGSDVAQLERTFNVSFNIAIEK